MLRNLLIREHITVSKHARLVGLGLVFFPQVYLISVTGYSIDQDVIKNAKEGTQIRCCQLGAKELEAL